MLLSRLGQVVLIVCSDSLFPFFSIVCIFSSQAIAFQILLYTLFPRFPWSTLLPFPRYFNFHNLAYLGTLSMHNMIILPETALNFHFLNLCTNFHLSRRTSVNTLSTSLTQNIILIIRRSTPRNLTSSKTVSLKVSQQYNKTGLTQH